MYCKDLNRADLPKIRTKVSSVNNTMVVKLTIQLARA